MDVQDDIKHAVELYRGIQNIEGTLWTMKEQLTKLINKMTDEQTHSYMEAIKEVE